MPESGVIDTSGLGDQSVYMQVAANLQGAYNNYGVSPGNYPKVDTIMTNRILNDVWTRNYLDGRIFVDGIGVTSVTSMDMRASAVRVPIIAPPPYTPRTIAMQACSMENIPGTPGNDGVENVNLPNVPQTDGVEVTFNQVYDQATVIYKISQNMLTLDIVGGYNRQIPGAVANMTDSSTIAQQMNHGLYRASTTDNSNAVVVDLTNSSQGYLQGVMNEIIGLLTNPQTSWSEGVVQFPLDRAVILMRQKLWNRFFTVGNGAIINSNIGQSMLVGGAFTTDGRPKGNNMRGEYSGVWIKVVPDSYFKNAARYLNLPINAFDGVLGYICHSDGTAFGRLDTTINPIPNPGNGVGTKIQNSWQWGVNVIRDFSIGVVLEQGYTNPITSLFPLVAPANWSDPYGGVQRVQISNGSAQTAVTLTVTGTGSANITNANLAIVTAAGVPKGYSNNADGTYQFYVPRGEAATVNITAAGYQSATVNITAANTATGTYTVTQALSAVTRNLKTTKEA